MTNKQIWKFLQNPFQLQMPLTFWLVTAIETVCHRLNHQDEDYLISVINSILQSSHSPKHNFSKAECKAIQKLKNDKNRIILTVDKGVAMVDIDNQDYFNKTENLIKQTT